MSQTSNLQIGGKTTNLGLWDTQEQEEFGFSTDTELSKEFVPTGITLILNLPIVYRSNNYMFGVNLDGYIPTGSLLTEDVIPGLNKNMFPVQLYPNLYSGGVAKIEYTACTIPAMTSYFSNRYVSGNIGVGIRVSSNTSQTGNFIVTHAAGMMRKYHTTDDRYNGLEFTNSVPYMNAHTQKTFALADLSLQRNWAMKGNTTRQHRVLDLAQKQNELWLQTTLPRELKDPFIEQMAEDWLLFGIISDLPTGETNQLTLSFYFDYSQVQFSTPMLNMIALGSNEVFDYTQRYYVLPPDKKDRKEKDYENTETKQVLKFKKQKGYSLSTEDKQTQTL